MSGTLYAPVSIGGVGGSGTRVVAELVKNMSFFIGNNLNHANDNMELSKLFPKLRALMQHYQTKRNSPIQDHVHESLRAFTALMQRDALQANCQNWGWKGPTNFFILEYLNEHFPQIKYIHVIRHGLDMAHSSNQQQLQNWGFYFDIDHTQVPLPYASLQYWIRANHYALDVGNQLLQNRFYLLNFDALCQNPTTHIDALARFLEIQNVNSSLLSHLVQKPASLGRYKKHDLSVFGTLLLEEVENMGFCIERG